MNTTNADITAALDALRYAHETSGIVSPVFAIDKGSKTYGRMWRLTSDRFTVFRAPTGALLLDLIDAYARGIHAAAKPRG